jgi:hypothetical protein
MTAVAYRLDENIPASVADAIRLADPAIFPNGNQLSAGKVAEDW